MSTAVRGWGYARAHSTLDLHHRAQAPSKPLADSQLLPSHSFKRCCSSRALHMQSVLQSALKDANALPLLRVLAGESSPVLRRAVVTALTTLATPSNDPEASLLSTDQLLFWQAKVRCQLRPGSNAALTARHVWHGENVTRWHGAAGSCCWQISLTLPCSSAHVTCRPELDHARIHGDLRW